MREENLALIKRGFEAFTKGDLDTIRSMPTDDAIWYTPGHGMFEPEYKGQEGAISYLTRLFELTDGTFKTIPESYFADDDKVVVLERITANRSGRMLDSHIIHVFEIRSDKVYRVTEYVAEPQKLIDFWS